MHVAGQRAVRLPLLNFLEAFDGSLDGGKIGERAAEPALHHKHLAGFLGRFLDADLGLLFGAHKQNPASFAHGVAEIIQSRIQLRLGLAQIDDVNPVARVENERFHLGIPTLRLMSKMDAGFQQFSNTDRSHNFPLVKTPKYSGHPAEHGIGFDVIMAGLPPLRGSTSGR